MPSNEITFLMPYGSAFFATAPLLEKGLPDVTDQTHNAVIVLGLRGEDGLGSAFLEVLKRYATDLQEHNSKLMLVGVGPRMENHLEQTKIAQTIGRKNIFKRTEKIGEAGTQAWDAAQKWLVEQEPIEKSAELSADGPTETADRKPIRAQVKKIGESASQA